MSRILLPFLVLLLFSSFGHAELIITESTDGISRMSVEYFNRHPGRQFICNALGSGPEETFNGGVGNGSNDSYFASGQDEASAYRIFQGRDGVGSPNLGVFDRGTYRYVGCIDLCRQSNADGSFNCGEVTQDDKQFVIGFHTHAMDIHPWGGNRTYRHRSYATDSSGGFSTRPSGSDHEGWQARNTIPDFLYSRLLLGQVTNPDWNDPTAVSLGRALAVELEGERTEQYRYDRFSKPFVDIPWTFDHLRWGFTCPQIAATDIYSKFNPQFQPPEGQTTEAVRRVRPNPIEQERYEHYRTLLRHATRRLGAYLNEHREDFENTVDTNVKGLREIFVNAWHILRTTVSDSTSWLTYEPPCEDEISLDRTACELRRAFGDLSRERREVREREIQIFSCPAPHGTVVDYRAAERVICIDPSVAVDCLSKRASNAHPRYNIGDLPNGEHCHTSYGIREGVGLYENTEQGGYQILAAGDHLEAEYIPGQTTQGYSPFIVAKIAHQLVHAYFQTTLREDRMENWPHTPESQYEETLATLTEFLVYTQLCKLGYCPLDFGMRQEHYFKQVDSEARVTDALPRVRFTYENTCRGFGGIFLGAYCSNALTTVRWLEEGGWEAARMMALLHSQAPMLQRPESCVVQGEAVACPWAATTTGSTTE